MATKPKVQSLASIMGTLNPSYTASQNIIKQQQAALPGEFNTQMEGLNVARQNAFRDINTGANSKGLAFSGIPSSEQMRYTGATYLPAVANLKSAQNKESLGLAQQMADLNKEQRSQALGIRQHQQDTLEQYLEAQRQREFEMQKMQRQAAIDRQNAILQAKLSRQNSAYSHSLDAGKDTVDPDTAAISYLDEMRGTDTFVSPQAFRNAQRLFVKAGGSNKDFMNRYWKYTGAYNGGGKWNQNNWQQYYYGA